MKARTGWEKGRHLLPRFAQKIAEGKSSYRVRVIVEWKVKLFFFPSETVVGIRQARHTHSI